MSKNRPNRGEIPAVMVAVETSVRTGLMAVWGLTGLQKPMIPVYDPTFDLRVIVANLKVSLGIDKLSLSQVPHILRSAPPVGMTARHINELPELPV